jgi:hypothetical protein
MVRADASSSITKTLMRSLYIPHGLLREVFRVITCSWLVLA